MDIVFFCDNIKPFLSSAISVTLISLKMKSEDFQTGMDDFRKTSRRKNGNTKEGKKLVEVEEAGDEEVVSTV